MYEQTDICHCKNQRKTFALYLKKEKYMKVETEQQKLLWLPDYDTGVVVIDNYHKKYLDIYNSLIDSIKETIEDTNMQLIFHKLMHYVENLLIDEEILFKEFHYPKLKNHKESHLQFTEKILDFYKKYNEEKTTVVYELADYLNNWFQTHILQYDKEAIEYLKIENSVTKN